MNNGSPEPDGKLRMAPPEPAADLAHRVEREQRAANLQRESNLESALAPFRVGSVSYLNAVPLTRGLEDEIVFATPARLAEMLRRDELDAGLVSVVEVLCTERYDILDGIAIASLGEVQSVLLAHRRPLAEVKEVYCDPASLTSVQLLRVLLAARGLYPEFKQLPSYDFSQLPDYALLIGDRALDLLTGTLRPAKAGGNAGEGAGSPSAPVGEHQFWDLGAAWYELTKRPFVYAVWALRRGVENRELRRLLREARDFGMDTLDSIIGSRTEYTFNFRKDYLGWHIHYHLGSDEKRGLAEFYGRLRQVGVGPLYEPRFVV